MGKFSLHFLIAIALTVFAVPTSAQFQPAPVEKSKQKILFQGKVYFIHKVLNNQTLFSISRAYGVTEQDIAAANPNLALEIIQPGQVLKIPEISTLDTLTEAYFGLSENDFYYHTIEPQQTVTYLTKKYNVSKEEIYKYNPGSEDVIQIGQVIKIPKPHIIQHTTTETETKETETLEAHDFYVVKPGDTLYSLSKKFGLSVAEIIEKNPDLRWGLKTGMKIHMPGAQIFSEPAYTLTSDSSFFGYGQLDLYDNRQCDSVSQKHFSKPAKIVVMLPFFIEETMAYDTITNDSIRKAHPYARKKALGQNFIEFYEGYLLAVDSLKRKGQKVTIFSYDTKDDSNQVDKILKEIDIVKPDMIIGPIRPKNVQRVSAYTSKHNIPHILPLSKASEQLTGSNPYAITMIPDFKTEVDLAAGFISQYHNKNIILIHNRDTSNMEAINTLRNAIFAHYASKSQYEKALYKEIRINDTLKKNLRHTLRDDKENIILIISDNEAYVSNVVGLLTIQDEAYKIKVFGLPSWQKFKNLRSDQLHELNTYLYSPFYIDYKKQSTIDFISLCREKLGYEPYKTARSGSGYNLTYLGYETGMVFLNAFDKYGSSFINCVCTIEESMPQQEYRFSFNPWGGFRINSINFINFSNEYDLVRIPYTLNPEKKSKAQTYDQELPEGRHIYKPHNTKRPGDKNINNTQ